jgi:hypothetical protein
MNKLNDLKNAIGKEFSDNYSNTLRSKLLSISKCGKVCTVISVDAYDKQGGVISNQPSWLTWNAIYY